MKVPRYHSISFLILPFIIYIALNFSLVGTVFLKEIITYTSIAIPNLELEEPNLQLTKEDLIKQRYAKDFSVTLVVIGFSVALFNLPFKIFFFKKKTEKTT